MIVGSVIRRRCLHTLNKLFTVASLTVCFPPPPANSALIRLASQRPQVHIRGSLASHLKFESIWLAPRGPAFESVFLRVTNCYRCTGLIIFAHWATYPALEEFGVVAVHERVVTDGNLITGGGVTAGIDFGLTVLATMLGEDTAKATQLLLEYDPQPPFKSGSPELAGEAVTAQVMAMLGQDISKRGSVAVAAAKKRLAAMVA